MHSSLLASQIQAEVRAHQVTDPRDASRRAPAPERTQWLVSEMRNLLKAPPVMQSPHAALQTPLALISPRRDLPAEFSAAASAAFASSAFAFWSASAFAAAARSALAAAACSFAAVAAASCCALACASAASFAAAWR